MEAGATYRLDVAGDYAGIRYPSAMQVVHYDADGHEKTVEGYVGGQSSANIIKARLAYGSIKIEE